jgi:hypothetical protein
MQLSDILLGLGEENFRQLLRSIAIGKLKSYQLYDRMKIRLHLAKINSEALRKAAPRLWQRVNEKDEDFVTELGQAVLVSNIDLIRSVLDFLGVPHEDGFFAKDLDPAPYLTEGWEDRVFQEFKDKFPTAVLLFYINHLGWELKKESNLFAPAAGAV